MNGGSKKFLYSGPKKKSVFTEDGDEDFDQKHWSYNTSNIAQNNFTSSTEFDLDDIWSIKKNINVPKEPTQLQQINRDSSDRNIGKGFYSRHGGGVTSEIRTTASPKAVTLKTSESFATGRLRHPSGKTWPRTYSYAYGNATQENKGKAVSPRLNRDFVKIDSGHHGSHQGVMPGGVVPHSQSKYSVQRGGRPDNKHLDF